MYTGEMLLLALTLACATRHAPPAPAPAPITAEPVAPPAAAPPPVSNAPAPAPDTPTTAAADSTTDPDAAAVVRPPVSLETFRAAFPLGTVVRLRIETADAPVVIQRWEWVEVDAEACTIAAQVLAEDGTLLADEGAGRSAWTELMAHAEFPADQTVVSDAVVEVPAGRFDTWLFTVTAPDAEGGPTVRHFHFAKDLPGPPVSYTIERAGVEVFRMTLLERTPRP